MKSRLIPLQIKAKLFLCFCLLLNFSCTQKVEGCLDSFAVNFQVDAEKDCCCTYPKLYLKYFHRVDSLTFSLGDPIYRADRQVYYLHDFQFYCSDFRLIDSLGQETSISETVQYRLLDQTIETFVDDVVLVDRNKSIDTLGLFPDYGKYNRLTFNVGLSENLNKVNASLITDDQDPLSIQNDTTWTEENGYTFNQIVYSYEVIPYDSIPNDTLIINGPTALIPVDLEFEFEFKKGFHSEIGLQIDYNQWFKDISFNVDDNSVMISKIIANTNKAFSISE